MINNRHIRLVACFFLGHDIRHQHDSWQPDWCNRCWYTDDEINLEGPTLPDYLNRLYCWLVERDWRWFRVLDERIPGKYLPRWWEY